MRLFRDRTTAHDVDTPRTGATEAEAREAERIEAAEARGAPAPPAPERVPVTTEPALHPLAATRARFGGIDVPASLVGMLTALALLVLLAGIVGAAFGAVGYQTGFAGETVEEITIGSLIGGFAILLVAYLVGGWTAGRIARYDGARNGLMTAVWTIVLAAVLSGLAWAFDEQYDVFANVNLPQWFDRDAFTTTALVTGLIAIGVMLVGGLLGGLWGTRYHRIADETLLETRPAA